MNVLAAIDTANGTGILCTILLFATIIAFIIGLAEALGFGLTGGRLGSRYSGLVVFVVLLIAYVLFC